MTGKLPAHPPAPHVDPDALLCALIVAPTTYSRNRFFSLFEQPEARRIRRRAARVRSVIRQLLGQHRERAEITGEAVLADGRVLLRYRIGELALKRTTSLSMLEAAALHYALHRAGAGSLSDEERAAVESALTRLSTGLGLPPR